MYTWHDSNYNKRIKLTIDGSKIEEDLHNFPIMIHLSDSSGITDADVTDIFDELIENGIILQDTFSGTSLDTSKWSTHITPNASVTVSGALELNNQTGDAHSGAQCDSNFNIPKKGILELYCKWKPHKNHYSSAALPAIIFYKYDITARDTYYGYINDKTLHLQLGSGSDTADRTSLILYYVDSGSFTSLGSVSITIDETQWHDIYWKIDCENKTVLVKLDDTYTINGTLTDSQLNSLGEYLKLEFSTSDYNKNNTEKFKDVYLYGPKDNSKKIALYTTISGVDTQCYVEIDTWPLVSGVNNAFLWAKVPFLASGVNQDLFLYYDKTTNNNSYVGKTTEYSAKQVWDSNFKAVYHLSQIPGGNGVTCILDSTSNNNDAITWGALDASNFVDTIAGKGVRFDVDDEFIQIPDGVYSNTSATVEVVVKDGGGSDMRILCKGGDGESVSTNQYRVDWGSSGVYYHFEKGSGGTNYNYGWYSLPVNPKDGDFHLLAWVIQPSLFTAQIDNYDRLSNVSTDGNTDTTAHTALGPNYIEHSATGLRTYSKFHGDVAELRISSVARSTAWVKATYYTIFDNLISYYEKEIKPAFIFNGYVQVNGAPVSRKVYLYRRSTGELVGSAVSDSSNGYFEITTPYNDYHFVTVLPELNETYNILVKDKIKYE